MKLAEAFGVAAVRVDNPADLGTAVAHAVSGEQPTLIELVASEFPSPWVIPVGD